MKSNMLDMKIKKAMPKKKGMPINKADQKRVKGYATGGPVMRGTGCATKGKHYSKSG